MPWPVRYSTRTKYQQPLFVGPFAFLVNWLACCYGLIVVDHLPSSFKRFGCHSDSEKHDPTKQAGQLKRGQAEINVCEACFEHVEHVEKTFASFWSTVVACLNAIFVSMVTDVIGDSGA